jgi:hypothetical protein
MSKDETKPAAPGGTPAQTEQPKPVTVRARPAETKAR